MVPPDLGVSFHRNFFSSVEISPLNSLRVSFSICVKHNFLGAVVIFEVIGTSIFRHFKGSYIF